MFLIYILFVIGSLIAGIRAFNRDDISSLKRYVVFDLIMAVVVMIDPDSYNTFTIYEAMVGGVLGLDCAALFILTDRKT